NVKAVWLNFKPEDWQAVMLNEGTTESAGGYVVAQLLEPRHLQAALAEILPVLGERIMAPVAEQLRALGVKQAFLVPGAFGHLPLHAACYHMDGEQVWFLDEFTVAYTPNAVALANAQRAARQRQEDPLLVGAGNPASHLPSLQAAQAE